MAKKKKGTKKKTVIKKHSQKVKRGMKRVEHAPKITTGRDVAELNKLLIENFVKLQKVQTHLVGKFEKLSENIARLLQLFELSARSFIEKQPKIPGEDIEKDKEFLDKLDKLLDQNKTIAKGLTLMEEKMKERVYGISPGIQREPPRFMPPRSSMISRPSFSQTPISPGVMQPSIMPSSTSEEEKENSLES